MAETNIQKITILKDVIAVKKHFQGQENIFIIKTKKKTNFKRTV